MDLYSRLLDERIIMLSEEFRSDMASSIVAQLLYLASEDAEKDITIYINSPGGSVIDMWSIIDTMNLIKPDVSTVCTGLAASAGSAVLAAGVKGKRKILPHAQVMIHQTSSGTQGKVSDMERDFNHSIKVKNVLTKYIAERTDNKVEKVEKDMDRDYWMDAKEAIKYGIVDKIIGNAKE